MAPSVATCDERITEEMKVTPPDAPRDGRATIGGRLNNEHTERISCEYRPRTGPAFLALVIFAMLTAGAVTIASTNSAGVRFFRFIYLGPKGFNALMWLGAAFMAAMALLSVVLLLNSFAASRRLELSPDALTLPKSRLSGEKQTIRLKSVISLKVVPNQKHWILKIRHSGGSTDVHSGLMPSMDLFELLCERMMQRHSEARAARAAAHAKG